MRPCKRPATGGCKAALATALIVSAVAAAARAEYIFSSDYSLHFGRPALSLCNAPMGQRIEVTIGWRLEGGPPKQDFVTHVTLVDDVGRTVAATSAAPAPATSAWQPNQIVFQTISLAIPRDRPDEMTEPIKAAHVFEGWHWLLVSLETAKGAKGGGVQILDNPKAQPFASLCRRYALCRLYVSSSPVAVTALDFNDMQLWKPQPVRFALRNDGGRPLDVLYRLVIEDESRTVLFEHLANVHLDAGGSAERKKDLALDAVGPLTARVEVYEDGRLRTQAERTFVVAPPKGLLAVIRRGDQVQADGLSMHTPIHVRLESPESMPIGSTRSRISYSHAAHPPLVVDLTHDLANVHYRLRPQPAWGYYDVHVAARMGDRRFSVGKRLVAAVFGTGPRTILCNGEPWICKGINVHGIFASRSLTAQTLDILARLGFNSIRGDHPVAWQRELAVDYHIGWVNLPYFSCIHTDKLYPQLGADPLATMREITRQACLSGADDAGTILWNCCNEIEGELDEVLANLYSVYKLYDPYKRPVVYANLFGQDRWADQDVMGINYYYDAKQSSTAKQALIRRSTQIGLDHNIPVVFMEFNSWWGPVSESGVLAWRDMFQFGLDIGMSGGTFYKLTDVIDRHPGIVSPDAQLQIRTELAGAVRRCLADAELVLADRTGRSCRIEVRNKRPFTLRDVAIVLTARGRELAKAKTDRILSGRSYPVDLTFPPEWEDQPVLVRGRIDFVTHHAFPCCVQDAVATVLSDAGATAR